MSIFNQIVGGGGGGKIVEVSDKVGGSTFSVDTSFSSLADIAEIYILRKNGTESNKNANILFFEIDSTKTRQSGYAYPFPNNTSMITVPTYAYNYTMSLSNGTITLTGSNTSSAVTYRVIVVGK